MPSLFDTMAAPILTAGIDAVFAEAIEYWQGATHITGITGIFFSDNIDQPIGQSTGIATQSPQFFIDPVVLAAHGVTVPKVGDTGDLIKLVATGVFYRVQSVDEMQGTHSKFSVFINS